MKVFGTLGYVATVLRGPRVHAASGGTAVEMTKIIETVPHFLDFLSTPPKGMRYRTLLIDPPWPETLIGKFKKTRHARPDDLPYPTLTLDQIKVLPVPELADTNAHV
ncbi:methyltransferase-A70 family protein [Frigoriglobus tundricola]|uniref:Uncharacterized protein n=1 Tax=Frigoriglobus tundricola TaxID=2774151 RepID=A0A6M5YNV7_9BACT|nr:hypothetical protein [Frigoriglobus tundricola]QJW95050.1 hypothetical protein FTUN_2576 [Frigoriglobus tundricola]